VIFYAAGLLKNMKKDELRKFTLDFIKKQQVAFVATASRQGDPQVAMILLRRG